MWISVDPLAEKYPGVSSYVYCLDNPIKYVDPDGRSTHTNQNGKVIAVYNDKNLGVYRHSDKSLKGVDLNKTTLSTKGAEKMGESLHSLSFADQTLYNKTGEVKKMDNMTIDFNSTKLTSEVNEILGSKPSLAEYAKKAGSNGDWDIKTKVSNGSLLNGKYASPRDAGNFAAGAVAQMSGIEPIAQFGYGAYNLTGNSKPITGALTLGVGVLTLANPALGITAATLISKFGEDKLSQRSIDLGKEFIRNKK